MWFQSTCRFCGIIRIVSQPTDFKDLKDLSDPKDLKVVLNSPPP